MSEAVNNAHASEPTYPCDVCGRTIEDKSRAFILCSLETLPEAPAIHLVRKCCLESYEKQFGRAWMLFSLASPSAGWLLPYPAAH